MVELLERHLPLMLGAEIGDARLHTGACQFWRVHIRSLTDQAGITNPDGLADILLAPLAPDIYQFQRDDRGLTKQDGIDAFSRLAHSVLGG
jgi:hypothetical protein